MENERRYAIKSVKTLEQTYQKYDKKCISHTIANSILLIGVGATVILNQLSNINLDVAMFAAVGLEASNLFMLINAKDKKEVASKNLSDVYNDLNIPEEERIIDNEGRSK